jgi:transposase
VRQAKVRTYIAEPERGRRKWTGKEEQQAAVYANRRRISGNRGQQLLRRRDELLERTFAHAYETGALRRLYVRGQGNVQKKLLVQAAACNLALLLRKMIGAGTPRALHDAVAGLFLVLLRLISLTRVDCGPTDLSLTAVPRRTRDLGRCPHRKTVG